MTEKTIEKAPAEKTIIGTFKNITFHVRGELIRHHEKYSEDGWSKYRIVFEGITMPSVISSKDVKTLYLIERVEDINLGEGEGKKWNETPLYKRESFFILYECSCRLINFSNGQSIAIPVEGSEETIFEKPFDSNNRHLREFCENMFFEISHEARKRDVGFLFNSYSYSKHYGKSI